MSDCARCGCAVGGVRNRVSYLNPADEALRGMIKKHLGLLPPGVDVNRRPDGTLVLRSPVACEHNLGRLLYQWAKTAPERTFVAERSGDDGEWRHLTYRAALDDAERIGQALLSAIQWRIRAPECENHV